MNGINEAGSGTVVENPASPATVVVTPDTLYKLSKKIAQLTKVIYSLNTRNDDLEVDLDAVRNSYEEKLHIMASETPPMANGGNSIEINEAVEAKSALAEAMHTLQQTENKLKGMEAEFNRKHEEVEKLRLEVVEKAGSQTAVGCDNTKQLSLLEKQVKNLTKEKKEMSFKIHRLDLVNESSRLETETLKKEITELMAEKNQLKLELSAARIEMNYVKEVGSRPPTIEKQHPPPQAQADPGDQFTDELIGKIETLTEEKAQMAKALEDAIAAATPVIPAPSAAEVKVLAETFSRGQQTLSSDQPCDACIGKSAQISTLEAQVEKLREELLNCEQQKDEVTREASAKEETARSEATQLSETMKHEAERSRQLSEQLEAAQADLEAVQQRLLETEAAAKADRDKLLAEQQSLSQQLSESQEREFNLKVDMGQNSEKLYVVEERCKSIEKERDDLKRRCKEFEAKVEVLSRSEKAAEKNAGERLQQLEKALEEALVEREEILEAAEKEIEAHKDKAIESEQKMMDDFEWKLREIEKDFRDKIKTIEDGVGAKVKTACDEIVSKKDQEFTRMSITMRREMDDKMRIERSALKTALETQNNAQKDKAIELYRLEKDHEIRILQTSWEDEQERLNKELKMQQRKVDNLPREIEAATYAVKTQCDVKLQEQKRQLAKADQVTQVEVDKVRLEMTGQLRRVQAQCDEKIAEYEAKLEAAHGNRMSSMFQMKDEVESEFTERMETLRDMYKKELDLQTERLEQERIKSKQLEETLKVSIKDKQQEIDDLNSYYTSREEELETKINDLLTRLQDSTFLAVKLQNELDEYEWYEEEEDPARPPSARSQHKTHSRPPSTKPLDQYKYTQSMIAEEDTSLRADEGAGATEPEGHDHAQATAAAAHNNYVSMTSLYATAQTSTASEVSNASSSANAIGAAAASSTTAASGGTYPLAEEAFLTEATSDVSPSSSPPPTSPKEPQQYTDESADTCSTMTATEDEDPEQKRAWHQRLFKSASQVNRRDSDSSSSEQSRQCVVDRNEGGGGDDGRGPEAEDEELQQDSCTDADDETQLSTSVSTSPDDVVGGTGDGTSAHNPNNPNNVALLPSRILMALSLMLILHAMIANL